MKIRFLGVGSAFTTPHYYQSNMLINNGNRMNLLLDCGCDVRFSFSEYGFDAHHPYSFLDAVYISHLHADHVGGLEWLAFSSYFAPHTKRLKLFAEAETMNKLWEHSLKGGLDCINGKMMHLTDYFECHALPPLGEFAWQDIQFRLQPMPHVLNGYADHWSYAVTLHTATSPKIFISTDSQFRADLIQAAAAECDTIFHDCETCKTASGVHAHYQELLSLPPEVRRKLWLYHYQPAPPYHAEADGFRGFVQKGQVFEF